MFADANPINTLIVGANGGIGLAFVRKLLEFSNVARIYGTYRKPESAIALLSLEQAYPRRLCCLQVDITAESQIADAISRIAFEVEALSLVINCVGILQDDKLKPEKSLRQIEVDNLLRYFQINSIGSLLLAKYLLPLLRRSRRSVFATLSAKVGSIGDNLLGGWYGYRASKAALNMFLRNVAIEYGRTSPNIIVVALHPGTTNTQLSQPFQKRVPADKLFSPERCAHQLLTVIENLAPEDTGQFFSWDGSHLPW
ncbi:MAG: SDR family NAD(P)-dependent oxidoreductase [Chloroflexaceae bacterium]|nr:SDR family NAD(P)-dependent oxidoreductase [Chloroflexaceae bacterium]